jgi:hypothetical protein
VPNYQCLQPNGKWAVFSTVVDSFVNGDLTEEECRDDMIFRRNYTPSQVERGFRIARREEHPSTPFLEYHWWDECVATIRSVHGDGHLTEVLAELGLPTTPQQDETPKGGE